MFKIIGAIMICTGSAAIGITAANKLGIRIRILNEWLSIFDLMHAEIKFLLTPVDELMGKCQINSKKEIKRFFDECINAFNFKENLVFIDTWKDTLNSAEYLELTYAEKQILVDLGNVLGRYDANEQATRIEHLRKAMEARAKAAESEKMRLGKLYSSLGVACGIALVIVFI